MVKSESLFDAPTDFIDVGHSHVAHYVAGSGPDLLLIHGWPLHGATFRNIVPHLSDHFTCHVVDLPGAGQTKWSKKSSISIREHVGTLRTVESKLGLRDYGIVSHDSGAVMARLLAADNQRVSALVLGNTEIPGHRSKILEALVAALSAPFASLAMGKMLSSHTMRHSPLGFAGCFADPDLVDGEFFRLFLEPIISSRHTAEGQIQLLRGFDWSTVDTLDAVHSRIAAPTLLIWGADDPFFPLPKARAMQPQFKGGCAIEVVRPGKLFVQEEFPEIFARVARSFLAANVGEGKA